MVSHGRQALAHQAVVRSWQQRVDLPRMLPHATRTPSAIASLCCWACEECNMWVQSQGNSCTLHDTAATVWACAAELPLRGCRFPAQLHCFKAQLASCAALVPLMPPHPTPPAGHPSQPLQSDLGLGPLAVPLGGRVLQRTAAVRAPLAGAGSSGSDLDVQQDGARFPGVAVLVCAWRHALPVWQAACSAGSGCVCWIAAFSPGGRARGAALACILTTCSLL